MMGHAITKSTQSIESSMNGGSLLPTCRKKGLVEGLPPEAGVVGWAHESDPKTEVQFGHDVIGCCIVVSFLQILDGFGDGQSRTIFQMGLSIGHPVLAERGAKPGVQAIPQANFEALERAIECFR